MSRHHDQKQTKPIVGDLLASFVVFIIAVPLSLGIAMASGTPASSAIVSIIIGGIVVGLLSGAPLVVSGPAAGLSALALQFVTDYGLSNLLVITALAGLMQVMMAIVRLGRGIQLIPKTVLEGVLSAIGVVIVLGQLHVLAGHNIPGGVTKNIIALPATYGSAIFSPGSTAFVALAIGLLAIGIQMLWKRFARGPFKIIPPALPAVVIATLCSLNYEIPRIILQEMGSYTKDSLNTVVGIFASNGWLMLVGPAFGLALVASAESLLTAKAIDVMAVKHHIKSKLNIDRELFAQGVGNFLSGIFGGLPITGVMVRSAANIESGAKTRSATIMHATWVGAFILFLPQVVASLPSAALASVLILTGIKLINFKHMLQAVKTNPREAYLWPLTAVAIMGTDLLKGLTAGLIVATLDYGYRKWIATTSSQPEKLPTADAQEQSSN
jgi:MFS superfamily sulfate permease-like transporter